MVFVAPDRFKGSFIIGSNHPAFAAGRHDLVLAKREGAGIPHGAHLTSLVRGSMRLCAVFHNSQLTLMSEFQNRIHVARPAGKVNSHDGARPWREYPLDGSSGKILALTINVGNHRPCAAHDGRAR